MDALTAVQKEYAALATEAQRAHFAQTQTQAATDQGDPYAAQRRAQYWWLPENQQAKSLGDPQALADQVKTLGDQISKAQEGMRDTAKKAADASKGMADQLQVAADNLKKSLDTADALGFSLNKAAEAARALAAATAAASAAGGSKPSGASDQPASSSGEYVWTGAIPPAGSVGGDYGRPSGSWGEPGDYGGWDNYDVGGTVPGPIGRPRRAIVHGGETVIPAGGGGGQPVMFVIQLAGRDVGSVLLPDLQEAISAGRLRFSGGLPGGRH